MKNTLSLLIACLSIFMFGCGNNSQSKETKVDDATVQNTDNKIENTNAKPFKKEIYEYHLVEAAGLQYTGEIVHGEAWTDYNGENIMIFCEREAPLKGVDANSYYLYAYHYANSGNGFKLIREVKDFFHKCEFYNHTKFQNDFIEVTDIDKNNYAEITFTYRVGCNSDPTPVAQKLLMLENGKKYAIRGTTLIYNKKFGIAPSGSFGGETNIDDSFNNAPEGFLDFAKQIWEKAYIY